MPSELETAMESLIMVFHRYAGKEGKSGSLTRRELRTLMENELSGFLKVRNLCHSLTNTRILVSSLSFSKTKSLVYQTFPQSQKDPTTIDRIMKDLDANGDGEVNFEEFVSLVVGLSIACEACYRMQLKKTQSWKWRGKWSMQTNCKVNPIVY